MPDSSKTPRERILRSARTLFANKGYEHASTSAIAREAGTSESQMMKYFGSKLGLLEAIFEEAWAGIAVQTKDAVERATSGPDKLRALINCVVEIMDRDPEIKLLLLLEGRRVRREDHSVTMTAGYLGFVKLFDSLLEGMRRDGLLRGQLNPQAVRSALFGMMEGLLRDHYLYERLGFPAAYSMDDLPRMLDLALASFLVPGAYSIS